MAHFGGSRRRLQYILIAIATACVLATKGIEKITNRTEIDIWQQDRRWAQSANKAAIGDDYYDSFLASQVYFPKSIKQVSKIVRSLIDTPISVVSGGHSSSNQGVAPGPTATAIDLQYLKSMHLNKKMTKLSVHCGALSEEVVEKVRSLGKAIPIGTGPTVGICGYLLNGGISGYFSKAIGLLGQSVSKMTVVMYDGTIKTVTAKTDPKLFYSMLGGGSALGILTKVTIKLSNNSIVQGGGQLIVPTGIHGLPTALMFAHKALQFMRDNVMTNDNVAMEFVVTADYTSITTFVFYDKFDGNRTTFADPLKKAASELALPVVFDDVDAQRTWYDIASILWPIINDIAENNDFLINREHSIGTIDLPTDDQLNFIVNNVLAKVPFDMAPDALMEVRTLGGAIQTKTDQLLPTGNSKVTFFIDLILQYNGIGVSIDSRKAIVKEANTLMLSVREEGSFLVDFSGNHAQADTDTATEPGLQLRGEEMFGSDQEYQRIRAIKKHVDPMNRFRFHPFGNLFDDLY